MSLSYIGADFAKSGKAGTHHGNLAAQLKAAWTKASGAVWAALSAPHVLPAMMRVTSALALSFVLVQLVKHSIS
jgi:hypothetical protein